MLKSQKLSRMTAERLYQSKSLKRCLRFLKTSASETAIAAAFYAMASGISEEVTDSILSEEEGNNIILRMRLHMIQESRGEKEQEYVETIDNAKKEIDLHSQEMVLLSETMKQYCDNAQSESNRRIAQLESQIKELSRENEEIRRVPQGEVTSEGYMQTQMISHTETAGHRTFAGLFSGRRKKTDDISEENRRYWEEKSHHCFSAYVCGDDEGDEGGGVTMQQNRHISHFYNRRKT